MRPGDEPADMDLSLALQEALVALDAANHAFGRFVTYVVRPNNEPVPPSVQRVREALQECYMALPDMATRAQTADFLAALHATRQILAAFLADPPPGYQLEEALAAPEPLDEAIEVIEDALRA